MSREIIDILIPLAVIYGAYVAFREFSVWWGQTSARTVDDAKLSAKFHGLILFGLDGVHQDISPVSSDTLIRFTKIVSHSDEDFVFRIDVSSAQISDENLQKLLKRISGIGGGTVSLMRSNDQSLTGEIRGSIVRDYHSLESVARSLISALGFDRDAKFKFRSKGPSDHQAVKEYFGLRSSSRDGQ